MACNALHNKVLPVRWLNQIVKDNLGLINFFFLKALQII
jgi:hypothetical protein